MAALGWLRPRTGLDTLDCYPLHPASVPVMARFFAMYGQNERSLFGFVASEEANGLRAFASSASPRDGFYGLDRFFDYVSTSFGHRLATRSSVGVWERIQTVLDGAASANAVETAVLKTVGLLNLLDAPDLIANEDSLKGCLSPTHDEAEVSAAIKALRTGGVLFERAARGGLRLWTSQRVDLSALWAEADQAVPQAAILRDLAATLATLPVRPFLLARRHSIETGVTRRFPVRLVSVSALASTRLSANADGGIVSVLAGDVSEARLARSWAVEASREDPTLIVVVVPPLAHLAGTVGDFLRHRWIEANAPVLREDTYASAEIERRLRELQGALVDAVEGQLGLAGDAADAAVGVYRAGSLVPSPPPLHILVSQACDELYFKAPLVQNELINRHALTSAAAAARQRVIEAMFASGADPHMGFAPGRNPPERALHLSLLVAGRIHRERDGMFSVDLPEEDDDPLRLRPALSLILKMAISQGERVAVVDIYRALSSRPYGVRAGFSPLLLATVLVANRHRIALFERGTYCPKLDAQAFMRILKGPEHFHLQWIALDGVRAEVYHRLAVALGDSSTEEGLLAVVAPMMKFVSALNLYVQRSDTLTRCARAVLDVLMRARSPIDLVFINLPIACGLPPFAQDAPVAAGAAARFADQLESAIAELQACYPSLLDRMRTDLGAALGISGELRQEITARAGPTLFSVREQSMRTFVQRIADAVPGDDAWIEALGGALMGKPPSRWLSQDVAVWASRLADACASFLRMEAASFGTGAFHRNAIRLAVTHADGRERVEIVALEEDTPEQATFLRSVVALIERNGMKPSLVLARLAENFVEAAPAEGTCAGMTEMGT